MLKRIVKIFLILSSFLFLIPVTTELKLKEKIDNIVISKEKQLYKGYIYIPKFGYKNVIKKDTSALDENLVLMTDFSDELDGSNIVLAGHNNRYVFNKLYYLNIGDEILISNESKDYKYIVDTTKYIKVDDYESLNNRDSLTLITCTNNNQKRYIVIAKRA